MSILLLKPTTDDKTYIKACDIFADLYNKVTGKNIATSIVDDDTSDLVVIGSDSVNDFLMNEYLNSNISELNIRYGTDDYCIKTYKKDNRNVLILAGGRGRSTIYAIYDYFERVMGCGYFWDGDIIAKAKEIIFNDISVVESPRFEYRGLRYFAHRGLKRFQAEHWSIEDWKKELDWMCKKRLNFFMMRIGMDDVWQRAFPDSVSYADDFYNVNKSQASQYDDRSDFWTLKYRGELREKVLDYARELDLEYPVDCGTMTHWYSRTPNDFLENEKPSFINQANGAYTQFDTGKVFDFTKKRNMDFYTKLSQTMVDEYEKKSSLFHTIGLGERRLFDDKKKNFAYKKIAYRRIAENIREKYPNSKLMLASWDFVGWWSPDEVKEFLKELDNERTLILDYTSDVNDPNVSFLNWGVIGKFPWIFGIFHAYESESELRGAYDRIEERLKVATEDKMCKGFIFWPELSHSDPIVLEYLSSNSWAPLSKNMDILISDFCNKRYGDLSSIMYDMWKKLLPFIQLSDWNGYSNRTKDDPDYVKYLSGFYMHRALWTRLSEFLSHKQFDEYFYENRDTKLKQTINEFDNIKSALTKLLENQELFNNEFSKRDSVDIIRTIIGRLLDFIIIEVTKNAGNAKVINLLKEIYFPLLKCMKNVLEISDDFSLYETLEYLKSVAPTNPKFETTLKKNICNGYCAQPAFELIDTVFYREADAFFNLFYNADAKNLSLDEEIDKIYTEFLEVPLEQIKPKREFSIKCVLEESKEAILSAMNYFN